MSFEPSSEKTTLLRISLFHDDLASTLGNSHIVYRLSKEYARLIAQKQTDPYQMRPTWASLDLGIWGYVLLASSSSLVPLDGDNLQITNIICTLCVHLAARRKVLLKKKIHMAPHTHICPGSALRNN